MLGSWRLCYVRVGVARLYECFYLGALLAAACIRGYDRGDAARDLLFGASFQNSAIGVATAVMEAPFLAKLHAYAEKLTYVTAGLQFWHKGIIYFLYVLTLYPPF